MLRELPFDFYGGEKNINKMSGGFMNMSESSILLPGNLYIPKKEFVSAWNIIINNFLLG